MEKEQERIFHCLYNDKIIGTKAVPLPRRMGTIAAPAEKNPDPHTLSPKASVSAGVPQISWPLVRWVSDPIN